MGAACLRERSRLRRHQAALGQLHSPAYKHAGASSCLGNAAVLPSADEAIASGCILAKGAQETDRQNASKVWVCAAAASCGRALTEQCNQFVILFSLTCPISCSLTRLICAGPMEADGGPGVVFRLHDS